MATWYEATLLGLPVSVVLWLLLLYSCVGVLVEAVFALVTVRRVQFPLGLLYLPLRPLYGVGGAACTVLLTPLRQHPAVVFALSVLVCSAVEYVAGWAVEQAFRTTSWDYSDKRANLHSRICLQYSLAWGVLATAALYGCAPVVAAASARHPSRAGQELLTVLLVLTLLSAVLTVAALDRARRRVDAVRTRDLGKRVRSSEGRWDRLVGRLVPDAVLIRSFPEMRLSAELRECSRDQRVLLARTLSSTR